MFKHESVLDLQEFDVPLVILTSYCRAGGHRERISLLLQPRVPGYNYINSNDIALTSGEKKKC